ncbi:MAG: DUF4476 domain-containing protein [Tannerella sp.]|jgi:hypothetical protein|nr:DUF4476 domain-containing protein [Tannerella sp.]
MKKQIAIFIFCFAAMASFAQIRTGSFRLTVDENTYNKQRSGTILIEGMQNFQQNLENILIANMFPGTYNLSIYFRNTPNSPEQNVKRSFTIEPGKTINFTLSTAGYLDSKYLLDNNSVDIMMPNLPGMPSVNVNFSLGGSVHHDVHDNHDHHDNRDNHHNAQVLPAHIDPVPISQADFNNLLASIRKENFDDTRVSTLKSACKFYPYFTSEHVKQLISLITFEGDKLECAQYLAPKVIDVQNLPLIKDVFKFSSTKDEWLDFLGGF